MPRPRSPRPSGAVAGCRFVVVRGGDPGDSCRGRAAGSDLVVRDAVVVEHLFPVKSEVVGSVCKFLWHKEEEVPAESSEVIH